MSRLRILTTLTTLVVVLAASQWCWAESITLTSSGGGVYDYALTVPPFSSIGFFQGATITLSGLSGVTGASTLANLSTEGFAVSSFTPSSVVYAQNVFSSSGFDNPSSTPLIEGTLVVDSSELTLGTVDFSMQKTTFLGTLSGTTQGPVAAVPVPEPASLMLLGTALLGLVGLARRRLSH